mgnify:CR=1 FL=1
MLMGIRFQAKPTEEQKLILSRWMGCARFIWNAKCEEDKYLSTYARRYLPIGTYADVNQSYSQYKDKELSPWLKKCPSQILRNTATNWYDTYVKFKKGINGKPTRKKKSSGGSIHLTNELFRFDKTPEGLKLFIGAKKNNIGYLKVNFHTKDFEIPKSIRIKKNNGKYTVSFCYEDELSEDGLFNDKENLEFLSGCTKDYLEYHTVGIDRGVARPVQFGTNVYDFTEEQKRKKILKEKYIKKYQKRHSKQKNGSKQREKTKYKIANAHKKIANIRLDFCHKTSKKMVDDAQAKVLIFEDLKTSGMTRKPKAKPNEKGSWDKNNAKAKAGLNKSILDKGWHKLEEFTKYKAYRAGKAVFKVSAHHTSQECADCGHIHPDNRKSQELFKCDSCGHTDNADNNAAEVIKKRAIKLILNSGTELSKRGVLLDSGRGAKVRRGKRKATHAVAKKRQKRQERSSELLLEAAPL